MSATDAVVPKIAEVMEAEIGSGVGAFEPDVIVNNNLRHPHSSLSGSAWTFWGGAGVITQRPRFPFGIDDTAVVGRKFGLGSFFS